MQSKTKKVTTEKIAEMMREGFDRMDKRVDEKINTLAIAVQSGFAEMEKKMATKDEMNEKFQIVFMRLDDIELKLSANISFINNEIEKLKERVDYLERKL